MIELDGSQHYEEEGAKRMHSARSFLRDCPQIRNRCTGKDLLLRELRREVFSEGNKK